MDDHVLRRRPGGRDLLVLGGVLLVAAALRLFFFTGVFGSDEVTYTLSAVRLLNGDPGDSTYIGALRYGINIPVALFMAAFGPSVWSASLWALSCGLADVALIYACARILWGATPALLAGLTVAFLPLHVHLSGRLLADTPVAAFVTLSIVLFLLAERRCDPRLHIAAGLASAGVLWIKQALVPYWGVFVVYVLLGRRWNWHWLWVIGGMAVGLAANCVAAWVLNGDPLYIWRVMARGVAAYGDVAVVQTSPWLYFRYLFVDVRHTWLLAYLAGGGIFVWLMRRRASAVQEGLHGTGFVVMWALVLIGIFSFFVISVAPLKLISKQSNYMLIFTSPLCLLAGYFLAALRLRLRFLVLSVYMAGSVVLAALAQQDIRVFTANSTPARTYAVTHPELSVYATSNAYRLATFHDLLSPPGANAQVLTALDEIGNDAPGTRRRVAIIDTQNLHWGNNPVSRVADLPACFERIGTLDRAVVGGAGRHIVHALLWLAAFIPGAPGAQLERRLEELAVPKPAYLYDIPPGCSFASSARGSPQ